MKLEEVLEKGRALALEKNKCYLLIIDEAWNIEGGDEFEALVQSRFGVEFVIAYVPDVNNLRLFELEKEMKDEL